jgi:hypothetical protein
MHPTLMHEIARYRQADMLREVERTRLAHEVSMAFERPQRRFSLLGRTESVVLRRTVFSR